MHLCADACCRFYSVDIFHKGHNLQCLCYLLFYKWWKPHFLISKRIFCWFLLNYTDFAHKIWHIKPSKYDSTFGTKISICLKKVRGMRLWIRTSTFNKQWPKYMSMFDTWLSNVINTESILYLYWMIPLMNYKAAKSDKLTKQSRYVGYSLRSMIDAQSRTI